MAARQIVVSLIADASKFSGQISQGADQAESKLKKFGNAAKVASAAALGGMIAIGKAGMEGVLEGVAAEDKFADAVSRSSKSVQKQTEMAKEKSEWLQKNTKFTYEEGLAIATNVAKQDSLTKAIDKGTTSQSELIGMSANLATVMGTDAASAADFLGKALSKPEKAAGMLRKAGIALTAAEEAQLKVVGDSAKAQAKLALMGDKLTDKERDKLKAVVALGKGYDSQGFILDKLAEKTKGAAEAAGDTLAGRMEIAKNSFGEAEESLVVGLLPAIMAVTEQATKFSTWAEENPGIIKVVAVAIIALAASVWVVNGAIKAYTAAQAVCNAVMSANPAVLIAIAIIALVAAIVIIATKTTWFQQVWAKAWGAIKAVTVSVFDFLKGLFLNFTPAGLLIKHFDKIQAGASKMGNGIKSVFDGVASAIQGAVSAVKWAWNSTIGGKGISIPGFLGFDGVNVKIPMLAKGGIVNGPTLAMIGERGPEAVVPLTGPNAGGGMGGVTVIIQTGASDLDELIRKRVRILGNGNVQTAFGR